MFYYLEILTYKLIKIINDKSNDTKHKILTTIGST